MTNNEEFSWMEFASPHIENKPLVENSDNLKYYAINTEEDDLLRTAKEVYEVAKKKEVISSHGKTFQVDFPNGRHFVIHLPQSFLKRLQSEDNNSISSYKYPVLFFFHGLTSFSWYCALHATGWIQQANEHNFVVVFGQGKGEFHPNGPIRNKYLTLEFGDTYWEIEDPEDDFNYLESICQQIETTFPSMLDQSRYYYVGYSNGAMFSSNVALRYGSTKFAAICNMKGGYAPAGFAGISPSNCKYAVCLDKSSTTTESTTRVERDGSALPQLVHQHPVPIMIITGTEDTYKQSCQAAKEVFEGVGCPVEYILEEGVGHTYSKFQEDRIWNFFIKI